MVGINTSGLSRSLNLTVPTATVNRVVDALLSNGRIARGFLGVAMQPVRLELAPPSLWVMVALAVAMIVVGLVATRARIRAVEVVRG